MAIETMIDDEKRIRLHRIRGEVVFHEIGKAMAEILTHPKYKSFFYYNAIWDFSDAVILPPLPTVDELRQLRRIALRRPESEKPAIIRMAIVAPSDIAFGLARMYEMFESWDSVEINVFRDANEANEWVIGPAPNIV